VNPLLTGADAVGILILIIIWASFVTLLGVWVGRMISRRK
jgi:hypothetical protein